MGYAQIIRTIISKREPPPKRGFPLAGNKMDKKKRYGSDKRRMTVAWMGCLACGRRPCDNHHVKSVGAGGTYRDIVPLCRTHHREYHDVGHDTFEKKYGLDLHAEAARISNMLDKEG